MTNNPAYPPKIPAGEWVDDVRNALIKGMVSREAEARGTGSRQALADRDRRFEACVLRLRAQLRTMTALSGSIGWMEDDVPMLLQFQWGERAVLTINELKPLLAPLSEDFDTELFVVGSAAVQSPALPVQASAGVQGEEPK